MIAKRNAGERAIPWSQPPYHVSARLKELCNPGEGSGVGVRYLDIEPGGRLLPHEKQEPELYYCLDGHGTFILDDSKASVHSGDLIMVHAGAVRAVVNGGEDALRLLIIHAAHRDRGTLSLFQALFGR